MDSSATPDAGAGSTLHSLKDVLRVLKERDIHVVKSTLWLWRKKLPPRLRPPIQTTMTKKGRLMLVSSRRQILEWVDLMEPRGLFALPRKHHETRTARLDRLARSKARSSRLG